MKTVKFEGKAYQEFKKSYGDLKDFSAELKNICINYCLNADDGVDVEGMQEDICLLNQLADLLTAIEEEDAVE